MIFKLHYWFLTSGACAVGILLGVFIAEYTDADSFEIGCLYMVMPLSGLIFRPLICSMADREQAHKKYMMICLTFVGIGYAPFVVVPFFGPEVYRVHPRICLWVLVIPKIIGDIAFGGAASIGDSVAINYARRLGVEFSIYRVWGTVAWMFFGLIIGQINETPSMPKYVPAFLILIASNLSNMFIIWLWPDEYFKMVVETPQPEEPIEAKQSKQEESALTKSLMPKEVVLAHMKKKLLSLVSCSGCSTKRSTSASDGSLSGCKQVVDKSKGCKQIGKVVQLKILGKLLIRDPRIVAYLFFFATAGMSLATLGFFLIDLSEICHSSGSCDFSQLTGFLQASVAIGEISMFIVIKKLQKKTGRLILCCLALLLCSVRYIFYGTIWTQINPYSSIAFEMLYGCGVAVFITFMAELGHIFSSEVQYLLPELIESDIIATDEDPEVLKLSLSATMQALIASANDGIGRGIGALFYGLVLEQYTFTTLWLILGVVYSVFLVITIVIKLTGDILHIHPGLDVAAKKRLKATSKCKA